MKNIYKYESIDLKRNLNMRTINYPISVYLKITTKCMLHCEFCSQAGRAQEEMDIVFAKEILKRLKKIGIINIYYTGGEPLLYKDLGELLEYGYELGFKQIIVTNGYMLKEKTIREYMKYVESIGVSIHGTSKIHNEISGQDCYSVITESLKLLSNENDNIIINVNCTAINKNTNYENFKFLSDLCKENKWKLTIARLNYIGDGKKYNDIDINNMFSIIDRINNEGYDIKLSNCTALCILDKKYEYLSHGCGAGQSIAAIESNGDVKICASSNYIIGNIKNKSFKRIWKNKKNNIYHKLCWIPKECNVCKDFLKCKGGCKAELAGEYWHEFCDEMVQKKFDTIWNEIENKKIFLNMKNVRKEKRDKYLIISIPYRICNKNTLKILKLIDGTNTPNEILSKYKRDKLEIKELLIAMKSDNLIGNK